MAKDVFKFFIADSSYQWPNRTLWNVGGSISAVTIISGSYRTKKLKNRKVRPILFFDLSASAPVVCNKMKNISWWLLEVFRSIKCLESFWETANLKWKALCVLQSIVLKKKVYGCSSNFRKVWLRLIVA